MHAFLAARARAKNNERVYQIKGNAMTSLSTNAAAGTATFNGKANIQDVTDPLNPVSIDGNATLQVTMTDRGEPGTTDTIAMTVWNKTGGLWFSSRWSGTRTEEQALAGETSWSGRAARGVCRADCTGKQQKLWRIW